jgi:hypothetical protein
MTELKRSCRRLPVSDGWYTQFLACANAHISGARCGAPGSAFSVALTASGGFHEGDRA